METIEKRLPFLDTAGNGSHTKIVGQNTQVLVSSSDRSLRGNNYVTDQDS
jgi:hypothetical protein